MHRSVRFALPWLVLLAVAGTARADALDAVRERGVLQWGADQEGGAPYIFPDPQQEGRLIGFEIELMEAVSKGLGVRSEFKASDWASLPDLLRARGIDVICNGYELTPEHLQTKISTIPYYVYELQLLARNTDAELKSWDDLRGSGAKARRVGVLQGSAAARYAQEQCGPRVEVVEYTGVTEALMDVQNRKLDATVQDVPIALHYADEFKLRPVGPAVGEGYYVIYLRPEDERLRDEINRVLRELIDTDRLRPIYERYRIWNATQQRLALPEVQEVPAKLRAANEADSLARHWEIVWRNLNLLLKAAGMTVFLSVVSMPLAILLGLLVALGRVYGPLALRVPLTAYVEVLRGTPLLLQLYVIYYVLPTVVTLPEALLPHYALFAAIFGLAVNYSAYEAEIYRAGLLAIPRGQMEAAVALGMTRGKAIRTVIVPQAVRLVIPPVTNDFIALFKDTAVCSVITVSELTKVYSVMRTNYSSAFLELAIVTGLLYLMMSYPLTLLARRLEKDAPPLNY